MIDPRSVPVPRTMSASSILFYRLIRACVMLKEVGLRCCTCTTYILQLPSHTHPDVFITDPLEDDVRGELSAAILQKLGEVKQGSSILCLFTTKFCACLTTVVCTLSVFYTQLACKNRCCLCCSSQLCLVSSPPSHEEKRSGKSSRISWASARICDNVTRGGSRD